MRWTLAGFIVLVLAYVGSKFVLEVILGRALIRISRTHLLGLILLNGVFAMSEVALLTARKSRLESLAAARRRASPRAAAKLRLREDPTRFLSTIQIGITSISILNGIVGEAVCSQSLLAAWLQAGSAWRRRPRALSRPRAW